MVRSLSRMLKPRALAVLATLLFLAPEVVPASAGGVITVENRTARAIKAVAPGGSAIVDPGSDPVRVSFDSTEPVGMMLQIWWIAEPRQLCRLFVPWDRTVVVTGDQVINCRSHD